MRKVCPKCGSIDVVRYSANMRCREPDCGHVGSIASFNTGGPGRWRNENQKWRDPVAMSMDGYDGG